MNIHYNIHFRPLRFYVFFSRFIFSFILSTERERDGESFHTLVHSPNGFNGARSLFWISHVGAEHLDHLLSLSLVYYQGVEQPQFEC